MAYTNRNLTQYQKQRLNQVIGAAKTALFDDTLDLHDLYSKAFTVYNGGEATFVSGVVEHAPTRDGPWATLIAIAGGTLGSASTWNWTGTTMHQFWKASAAVASGSVATVSAYVRVV